MEPCRENVSNIDPEPYSTIIIALGAAGSIASLISLVQDYVKERQIEREVNSMAIRDAIMGVETALNELRGYVRSLEIAFVAGCRTRPSNDTTMRLARFGSVQLIFTGNGHERWREIEEGILTTAGRINKHMSHLMRHFATTKLKLKGHTAKHLENTIGKLNELIGRLSQIHYEDLFRELESVVGECADVMRNLRNELNNYF